MSNKTKWQWVAMISWILGIVCSALGWLTRSWVFIGAIYFFYGVALWCVVYRPVRKSV